MDQDVNMRPGALESDDLSNLIDFNSDSDDASSDDSTESAKEEKTTFDAEDLFSDKDDDEDNSGYKSPFDEDEEDNEPKQKPSKANQDQGHNDRQQSDFDLGDEGSPDPVYSSIASSLREEGIISALSPDIEIKSAEDLLMAIQEEINSRVDESYRRVDNALSYGMPVDEVAQYEQAIGYLNSITDEALTQEGQEGESLRANLIYQDYINRGYSEDRARREVEKSISSGNDINDARDAVSSTLDYYGQVYNFKLDERRREVEYREQQAMAFNQHLADSILKSNTFLSDIEVDENLRRAAARNILTPIYEDRETGERLSELHRYQEEHPVEFYSNVAMLFTLTDGFKNTDKLLAKKLNREKKKHISNLERTINNSRGSGGGTIKLAGGYEGTKTGNGYIY